jgi:hypothetical protein
MTVGKGRILRPTTLMDRGHPIMPPRSHRQSAARARKIAVAVTGALVLSPAAAHAATVDVGNPGTGPQIQLTGQPGEANAITVTKGSGTSYLLTDSGAAPLAPASGSASCVAVTPSSVNCSVGGLNSVLANLGDGNDSFDASALAVTVYAFGQDGDDTLSTPAVNDFNVLDGGAGNDTLRPGLGVGDDLRGGDGVDMADYSSRTGAVVIDNDGGYSSGEYGLGEYDRVRPDVEALVGGSGNDTLRGNDGNDLLLGNDGSDRLDGGTGSDDLRGGAGDDTVVSRDSGVADGVDCGAGSDSVTADRSDTLAGCESVDVPALAATPAPVVVEHTTPVDREVVVERERIVEKETVAGLPAGAPSVVTITQRELVFAPSTDVISIKLTCGAENKRGCAGDVVITANVKRPSKGRARSATKAAPAPVVLARGKFQLKAGETRTVSAKIARRGVKQAFGGEAQADAKPRGGRRIKATMSVSTKGSDGSSTTIIRPVTVTVPTSAR